jgi:hypothetical protein
MKIKNTGIFPLVALLLIFSPVHGDKVGEIEITAPIIKLHSLPSAESESDIRGFAFKGQHYSFDMKSGAFYRVWLRDSIVWVDSAAVKVLVVYKPVPDQAPAISPQMPVVAKQSVVTIPNQVTSAVSGSAERVVTLAPQLAINKTPVQGGPVTSSQQNSAAASGNAVSGYQSGTATKPSVPGTAIAYAGKAVVAAQKTAAKMSSGLASAAAAGTSTSLASKGGIDPLHPSAPGTPVAAQATASPFARPLAPGTDGALEMHATAAAPLASAPLPGGVPEAGNGSVINASKGATAEEVEATLIRNGGRAIAPLKKRTWFSQFSNFGKVKSGRDIAFFQVNGGRSSVYTLASIDAGILMTAQRGDFFPLLEERASWCKVALKDTAGWIERNKGIVVSTPSSGMGEEWMFIVIVLASLAVVAALLLFLRYKARLRKRAAEKKIGEESALEGNIAESNLPEVLQFIEIGRKTGCLQLEDGGPLGIIYFMEGRIVHAAAIDNHSGRDAVNFILGLQQGSFRFLLDKHPKVRDLDLSTIEVLMEWTKTSDEAHRN